MTPEQILEQADTCVKCGLCLPHCPTYRKGAQEAESPRGRIALVQGLLSGTLQDSPRLAGHLDRCLECHACEAVCPSGVPVTHVMDAVRAMQMEQRTALRRWLRRWLLGLALRPAPWLPLLRHYQHSRMRTWLRTSGLLQRLGIEHAERLLPERPLADPDTGQFPASSLARGQVALFPGCVGRYLDASALQAATTVLTHLGFAVALPRQPCCCGAQHRHEGFARQADLELARSSALFEKERYERILTLASACLGELRQTPDFANRVRDESRGQTSHCTSPCAGLCSGGVRIPREASDGQAAADRVCGRAG